MRVAQRIAPGTSAVRLLSSLAHTRSPRASTSSARSTSVGSDDDLTAALRLLRPGGVVAFAGALADGRVADPGARDGDTVAARDIARLVRDEPRLLPTLLPLGPGLLAGVLLD